MHAIACCLALLLPAADEPKLIEKKDAFEALAKPELSICKDEATRRKDDLKDDDRVLCWTRGKNDGGAIPIRFLLNKHRIISDKSAVFVHDPEAGFSRAFLAPAGFKFHGWRNGVMVMEFKDGSLVSALTGECFAGPNKGKRIAAMPTLQTTWGYWADRYPDSMTYKLGKVEPVDAPAKAHPSSVKSRAKEDSRLEAGERVLGVTDGREAKAYRLTDLKKSKLIRDKVNGLTVHVLYHEKSGASAAYSNRAVLPVNNVELQHPESIELSYDEKNADAPFKDKETGSSFDIAGRCVSGKLKGYTLTWLDAVEVKWFAWAAEHPKTTIHGKE